MPSEKSCHLQTSKIDQCTPQDRPVYSTEGFYADPTPHDPNSGLELASQGCLGLETLSGTDQSGRAGPALGWVIYGRALVLTLTWHNHGHPPTHLLALVKTDSRAPGDPQPCLSPHPDQQGSK